MNDSESNARLDALFALARSQRADTSAAEFAFETRLMARLRESNSASSIWARVSWRMIPAFAACVIALAVWHSQVVTDTDDAEQIAYVQNPDALDAWSTLD